MREREKKDNGEWEEVSSKRKQSGVKEDGRYSLVKFYIIKIPDGCRPWDLASPFKEFGEVVGSYIARKKNKDGQRFGFITFKGVKDGEELEGRLQGVRVGKFHLTVNITIFATENEKNRFGFKAKGVYKEVPRSKMQPQPGVFRSTKGGFSFKDAVLGNNDSGVKEKEKEKEKVILVNPSIRALAGLYMLALIVKCVDLKTLYSLKSLLGDAGFPEVEVSFLDGLSFLLSFGNEETTTSFVYLKDKWRSCVTTAT